MKKRPVSQTLQFPLLGLVEQRHDGDAGRSQVHFPPPFSFGDWSLRSVRRPDLGAGTANLCPLPGPVLVGGSWLAQLVDAACEHGGREHEKAGGNSTAAPPGLVGWGGRAMRSGLR